GALAREERRDDALGRQRRRVVVHRCGPEIGGRAAEALQGHQAAQRLEHWVEARPVRGGPAGAEGGDRRIGQAPAYVPQPPVADAQALGNAWANVLRADVRALGELFDDLAAFLGLEIPRERALAAIPAIEARQLAERITLERLDLDDRRSEVGQLHRGVGAGDVAGQVDDLDTVERRRGRGHGAEGAPLPRGAPDDLLAVVVDVAVHRLERLGTLEVDVQVVFPREADAAVHLDRLAAHLVRGVGHVRLGDRGRQLVVLRLGVERPRRIVDGRVR